MIRVGGVVALLVLLFTSWPEAVPSVAAASAHGIDLANLDLTCPACKDFAQFATGGWAVRHPVPPDRGRYIVFSEVAERNQAIAHEILEKAASNPNAAGDEKKIGDLYASCMDEAAIERAGTSPLEPYLAVIEGIKDEASLADAVARLHAVGFAALWGSGATIDTKNSTREIAFVAPAGLTLPGRDFYLKEDAGSRNLRDAYLAHVTEMFVLLGDDRARATTEGKTVLSVETQLASAQLSNVERRDPTKTYHLVARTELGTIAPHVDWSGYFRLRGFPAFSELDLNQPSYTAAMDRLLAQNLADVRTYLRWRVLTQSATALPKRFADADFAFGSKLTGAKLELPRYQRCTSVVDGSLGDALGRQWVAVAFPPQAKARAREMVRNLTATLADDLKTLSWMSEPTRRAAQAKLSALYDKIGYPDRWRDYSAVAITRTDYFTNLRAARRFSIEQDLAFVGKAPDRERFRMTPPTVNASYTPQRNEIVFPAGILRPPFFDPEADDAVNYGAIGAVIGHEMTHGFDDQGRLYDGQGNLRDWWTPQDAAAFNARAKCIIDQYDAYVATGDVHVNGKLVVGEAIADLGGVTIAYRAFERASAGKPRTLIDGYTPEQRFFLGFAQVWAGETRPESARTRALSDPHPPDKYRVIGPFSNMPEFAAAFHCQAGDPMVRPANQRCKIW